MALNHSLVCEGEIIYLKMRGFGLFVFYIENLDQVRVPMRESVPLYEQTPSSFLEPPWLSIIIRGFGRCYTFRNSVCMKLNQHMVSYQK